MSDLPGLRPDERALIHRARNAEHSARGWKRKYHESRAALQRVEVVCREWDECWQPDVRKPLTVMRMIEDVRAAVSSVPASPETYHVFKTAGEAIEWLETPEPQPEER
jgi:hypothetical protein